MNREAIKSKDYLENLIIIIRTGPAKFNASDPVMQHLDCLWSRLNKDLESESEHITEVRHPTDLSGKIENRKYTYCYHCGTGVKNQKYCHGCGYKLDWSTSKNEERKYIESEPESKEFEKWFDKVFGDTNHPEIIKRRFYRLEAVLNFTKQELDAADLEIKRLRRLFVCQGCKTDRYKQIHCHLCGATFEQALKGT